MSLGDAACDGQADAEAAGLGAAGGVGIDSNGDLNVSGGEIYVSGPTSDGDSTLDYDGAATVTGGTIVAAGYSGMAQNFGSDSTQGSTCTVTIGGQSTDVTLERLIYGSGGMGTPPDGNNGSNMGTPPDGGKGGRPGNKSALFLPPK